METIKNIISYQWWEFEGYKGCIGRAQKIFKADKWLVITMLMETSSCCTPEMANYSL